MQLRELLEQVDYTIIKGSLDIDIDNVVNDSRKVNNGSLFVCIDGFEKDGHSFIGKAIAGGARAIIVQKPVESEEDITIVKVHDTRRVLAVLANNFYDTPSEKFELIGVTGTNGKTSTVFLLKNILEAWDKKTGIIGTIENRIGDKVIEAARTTPESIELQQLFSQMVNEDVDSVIMEVSSHALDLNRVDGCKFDVGIFTNLTLDHLEYHKTMDNYRDAKLKLFHMTPVGIINIDDKIGKYIIENGSCNKYITYGCENAEANLNAVNIKNTINGTSFNLNIDGTSYLFKIQTPGKFSVYNALCAIGASLALKVPVDTIKKILEENSTIRGRFQTLKSENAYYTIVDYAHTPDGLENVLNTIKEFATGKIITVFGCGGDRDKSKRSEMGKIAGEKSHYAIITSDNPRTEDPLSIINEIEAGIIKTNCIYEKLIDREAAIYKALSIARKDDIVLIAGKGHEDYQIIGKEKTHFDDIEKVKEFFKSEAKK